MSEVLAQTMDASVMEQPAEAHSGVMDRIRDSRFGELAAKFAVVAAFVGGGDMLATDMASADMTAGNSTTITQEGSNTTIVLGKSHMSESAFASATIMTNDRTISKVKINELKANGQCEVFNGKKVDIHTQGHVEGGVADGRDTRKSLFCHDAEGWFRAACGNRAWINVTPPKPVENVIWAGNKFSLNIKTKANATAQAECTTPNGLASASSYGHGMGYAAERLKFHMGAKANAHNQASKLIIDTELAAKAKARSQASAQAAAECEQTGGTVTPPNTPPKDGTQGPGTGTPGQPGGPGAGGQPGNPTTGETCRDDASTTNGDLNTATSGDIMTGTPDQFGYCVGEAQPLQ